MHPIRLFFAAIISFASLFGGKVIKIDLSAQTLTAFENNTTFLSTIVTCGTINHPTPTGSFSIFQKMRHHKSNLYPADIGVKEKGGADMPYTLKITEDGIAIHEGYVVMFGGQGYPASHGCIRVPSSVSSTLFYWAEMNTKVLISGETPPSWNGEYEVNGKKKEEEEKAFDYGFEYLDSI